MSDIEDFHIFTESYSAYSVRMPSHSHQRPLYSYHQLPVGEQLTEDINDSCYLCLACVCRRLCRPMAILSTLFLTLCLLLIWVIALANAGPKTVKDLLAEQTRLNQRRYLDGRWGADDRPLITVLFQGRLGNEMFEYAALYCAAKSQKMKPVIDNQQEMWGIFSISAVPKSKARIRLLTPWRKVQETKSCVFDPKIENLERTYTLLFGYFQSWKYFRNYEQKLREEFTFSKFLTEKALSFLLDKLSSRNLTVQSSKLQTAANAIYHTNHTDYGGQSLNAVTLVGIHVRQGDMVHSPEMVEYGYTAPNMSYFDNATDYFRNKYGNILFVVCTDQLSWVYGNMNYSDMVVSDGNSKEIDMAILSLCDHTIISVGSFGWWSAWLTNGEVTYYDDWPRLGSQLWDVVNKTEYFPPHWIPMM